ncbi:MAG: hypothetical protein WCX65_13530, partial [bacterium]
MQEPGGRLTIVKEWSGMAVKKIEIVTWYKCNCVCSFCASPSMSGGGFTTREIAGFLSEYRKKGASSVDFGGG